MNNAADVIMATVISSIFLLGILVPFWYYTYYDRIKRNNIWRKGKKFSAHFQQWIFCNLILIINIYLFSGHAFDDPYACAYGSLLAGIVILAFAIIMYLSIVNFDVFADKYLMPTNVIAPIITSIGLLVKGITWAYDYIPYWFLDHIFISASVGVIVYAEILFLRNNKWKFLPSHPK